MGGKMNCGYIASKPGILKLLTVIVGVIGIFFIVSAYDKAASDKNYLWRAGSNFNSGEENCQENYEYRQKSGDSKVRDALKPCPRKWMIDWPLTIVAISLGCSFILLIVLLFVELNKNGLFNQLDFIGHLVAGLFQTGGAIIIFIYVGFVFPHAPCDPNDDFVKLQGVENCEQRRNKYYQIIYFSIAGAITLINGILYFIAAPVIKRS